MILRKITVGKITVRKITVGKITVRKITVRKITVRKITVRSQASHEKHMRELRILVKSLKNTSVGVHI